jgi:hypothetical protein
VIPSLSSPQPPRRRSRGDRIQQSTHLPALLAQAISIAHTYRLYSRVIPLAIRQGSGSSKSPIRRTGLQARKSVSRKLVRLTSNLTKPNQEESYSPTLSLTEGTGQTALRHRRLALHMVAPCGDATNKFTHKSASPKRDVL